jgi:phospholipase A1
VKMFHVMGLSAAASAVGKPVSVNMSITSIRTFMWQRFTWFLLAACLFAIDHTVLAAEPANEAKCLAIANEHERVVCYDTLATRNATRPRAEPLEQLGAPPMPEATPGVVTPTSLSVRWELEPETKQGTWLIRPYEPIFILPVRYSEHPNDSPQSPSHPAPFSVPLDNTEIEFQLSMKVKAAENLFGSQADLWFAYTQQSQWQAYNNRNVNTPAGKLSTSSLFRETDYNPQIFVTFPTHYDLAGLTGRFINVGLWHQSNGSADPASRSWNRVFAQFGFERGNFALYLRPWIRIKESASDDDNSDIVQYEGYGDVTGIYQWGRQEFSLLGRLNAGNYGLQGTWDFPIQGRIKGYVKATSGYSETLIDYNWRQNTIGVGILLVDWL